MTECNPNYWPWSQKVLPLTYDESLSYYEVLCKLRDYINEMGKRLDDYGEQVLAASKAYTDGEIAKSVQQYNQALQQLTNDYNEFADNVTGALRGFQNQMDSNFQRQDNEIAGGRAYTDTKISQNNEWLLEQISQQLISVTVLNPFTGERESIQDMIDYLSSLHMTEAITIIGIGTAQRTVNKVISYNATCTQLVNNGKNIFAQA
jgi:hypothetical protein